MERINVTNKRNSRFEGGNSRKTSFEMSRKSTKNSTITHSSAGRDKALMKSSLNEMPNIR